MMRRRCLRTTLAGSTKSISSSQRYPSPCRHLFVLVWMALRLLLRRLYFHPTRSAYQVLRVTSLSGEDNKIRLFEPRPSFATVEDCLEHARDILKLADTWASWSELAAAVSRQRDTLVSKIEDAEKELASALEAEEQANWTLAVTQRAKLQGAMAFLSAHIITLFERDRAWAAKYHRSCSRVKLILNP